MVERRLLKNFDFALLAAAIAIVIYGCMTIWSASKGNVGLVHRQMVWAVIGLVAAVIAASIDHGIYNRMAGKLYVIGILMLLAVHFAGTKIKGSQRWIGYGALNIQPSEIVKIILIVALAVFLVRRLDEIRGPKTFALSFLYVSVPMLLIFRQPDLGTSLVFLAIWLAMIFITGTAIRNIAVFAGTLIVLGLVFWNTGIIKPYQKARLITFVNPSADPRGAAYHVTQARIAIGSGHIFGKGWRRGTQRELGFVPEPHTDFIFTVVGEELGFAGASALVILYFILLWRGLDIMSAVEDPLGRAIAAGIVGMLFFHVLVNIGMNVGVLPVTGVPLPMFSYGGSSLMANLIAIGLLEGISMRRHRISF